jgi:hypothetical protein
MKLKPFIGLFIGLAVANAQVITTEGSWKLVGAKEGINPHDSFLSSKIQAVWTYDESTGSWNLFSNTIPVPPAGINTLNYIDSEVGFWIKTSEPITIDTLNGSTHTALDKTYLIGETFYYLDKNISTKIYEENLSMMIETNASYESNNSYYPDYQVHSIYFGSDYLTIDEDNNTFGYLSLDDNTFKVYNEKLKNSTLDINGFTDSNDVNITLNLNPQNPYTDSNVTDNLNGTFLLSKEHINFNVQPLHTYDINNTTQLALDTYSNIDWAMMYNEVRNIDLNGTWSNIPVVEINSTHSIGDSITLIAKSSDKKLYIYDHNSTYEYNTTLPTPQGSRIQLFPYNVNSKISNIMYSKNSKVLAVKIVDKNAMYYYNSKPTEYIVLDIQDPFNPQNQN